MQPSPALSTVLDLAHARTQVVRDVDAALGSFHGIGLNDLALMIELYRAPKRRLRRVDLAARLGITPSGVARQLLPLERIGVVDRESAPTDARLALVVLTSAGARVVDEALPTADDVAARALASRWTGSEQESLQGLLHPLRLRSAGP